MTCTTSNSPSEYRWPYYTQLERGDIDGVSDSVLNALAGALKLDDAERAHLFDLARAAQPAGALPRPRRAPGGSSRPTSSRSSTRSPAPPHSCVMTASMCSPATRSATPSIAKCSRARSSPPIRSVASSSIPAPNTSTAIGRAPPTTASPSCAPSPAATPTTATSQTSSMSFHPKRRVPHPLGRPQRPLPPQRHQALPPPRPRRRPGLTIFTYTAEPGTRDEETLNLLGSWAATTDTLPASKATQ
jgi:hypothetical protein